MEKSVTPGGALNCGRRVKFTGAVTLCEVRSDIQSLFILDINLACFLNKDIRNKRYL